MDVTTQWEKVLYWQLYITRNYVPKLLPSWFHNQYFGMIEVPIGKHIVLGSLWNSSLLTTPEIIVKSEEQQHSWSGTPSFYCFNECRPEAKLRIKLWKWAGSKKEMAFRGYFQYVSIPNRIEFGRFNFWKSGRVLVTPCDQPVRNCPYQLTRLPKARYIVVPKIARSPHGGVHKWGIPKMLGYHRKSHENGWVRGTPISGKLYINYV